MQSEWIFEQVHRVPSYVNALGEIYTFYIGSLGNFVTALLTCSSTKGTCVKTEFLATLYVNTLREIYAFQIEAWGRCDKKVRWDHLVPLYVARPY